MDRPHLLIIDSHKAHIYNVAFFQLMRKFNIHVMAIPAHTSHLVQALDSTPFANFKKAWERFLYVWNFDHFGAILGKGDFWDVFWPAWKKAMTVENIQAGFRKTGIYPFSFEASPKEKMGPSNVTDTHKVSLGSPPPVILVVQLFSWQKVPLLPLLLRLQNQLN